MDRTLNDVIREQQESEAYEVCAECGSNDLDARGDNGMAYCNNCHEIQNYNIVVDDAKICETCGEVCDPEFIWSDYAEFDIYFCSERCMRQFENIGK